MSDFSGSPISNPSREPIRTQTVIVGAGPAGLAAAVCLQRAGVPFLLLERSARVGEAWHGHYQRLHLHTDKSRSQLPYLSFPKDSPRYPARLEVIDYLEAYARRFGLAPRFHEEVVACRRREGEWQTETRTARYASHSLVLATGYNRLPNLPSWPGQESFQGTILHTSAYRDGAAYQGKRVLVVGFGNSGGEIAIDLCEHGARVSLAVRNPVTVIPRELLGIPILAIGIPLQKLPARLADLLTAPILRAVFGDLAPLGLKKAPEGPFAKIQKHSRIPLIDIGTIGLIRKGQLGVYPGLERFTGRGVVFTDGGQKDFDAVILATGFRPAVDAFLEQDPNLMDEGGTPLQSGCEARAPGLYFCGYRVTATGMLREIAMEARHISRDIARNYHRALSDSNPESASAPSSRA